MADAKKMVENLLAEADIRLDGDRPWDMQVYNDELYGRLLREGTLGLGESFDHAVSLGMFEHVGHKNYRTYFRVVDRCLPNDGVFVLHTIGANSSRYNTDPWIEKYIFPNSMIPSMRQIASAMEGMFGVEEWINYGPHYDRTLMAWYDNFREAWEGRLQENYSERFYRMWEYYLLASAGSFRAQRNNQWHIVLNKR